jgi:hypothetical protein
MVDHVLQWGQQTLTNMACLSCTKLTGRPFATDPGDRLCHPFSSLLTPGRAGLETIFAGRKPKGKRVCPKGVREAALPGGAEVSPDRGEISALTLTETAGNCQYETINNRLFDG